jgi:hypothetical protein
MPIIINGGSRKAGSWWAKHLTNRETNDRVEVKEIRGLASESIANAFAEMRALALGTKCENYFYQANINPRADEHLTPEQWQQAVDTLERNLGLSDQPRFVIEHEKNGRTHQHIVWSRIDVEHQRAIPDSLTARIHEQTSRELEIAFDLEQGRSVLVADRDFERPERGPEKWALFRGERHGNDVRDLSKELSALWAAAESGEAFRSAIEERGYILACGDRRDFVIIDEQGDVHSLARRIAGARAREIREGLSDLDRASLPGVDEAKALIALRCEPGNGVSPEPVSPSALKEADPDVAAAPDLEPNRHSPESSEIDGALAETPASGLDGNPLKGLSRALDGVARVAESILGLIDIPSVQAPHTDQATQETPRQPTLDPRQNVEVQDSPDERKAAILRAIEEMRSTLRQDRERRDREGAPPLATEPEQDHGRVIERER